MTFRYEEFDLSGVRTYPLASRKSKASAADFAVPYRPGTGVAGLLASLPRLLAGNDFRVVTEAILAARRRGAGVVCAWSAPSTCHLFFVTWNVPIFVSVSPALHISWASASGSRRRVGHNRTRRACECCTIMLSSWI